VDYERMNRIKPYQQFDRDEYEQQGIGNGLYITKSLLDLNKGELNVFPDSEHQMTVVEVKIPLG
jgi:K+-sensing histidine kinase KdpD